MVRPPWCKRCCWSSGSASRAEKKALLSLTCSNYILYYLVLKSSFGKNKNATIGMHNKMISLVREGGGGKFIRESSKSNL